LVNYYKRNIHTEGYTLSTQEEYKINPRKINTGKYFLILKQIHMKQHTFGKIRTKHAFRHWCTYNSICTYKKIKEIH